MQAKTHPPSWDPNRISTLWFDSHFNHAAERVIDWLTPALSEGPPEALLDFGCGGGITTLGVALRLPETEIHGVDIREKFRQLPEMANDQLGLERLPDNLHLRQIVPLQPLAPDHELDAIFSWSVFEHVPQEQIPLIFSDLHAALKPEGLFFLQIEPLYYSPWGSHLRRFIDKPWAHLLWPAEKLRQAVLEYEGDIPPQHQGHQYHARDMESFKKFHLGEFESLNRITANNILKALREAGFRILKEQRLKMDISVPRELLETYDEEILLNNGLLVLAQKQHKT